MRRSAFVVCKSVAEEMQSTPAHTVLTAPLGEPNSATRQLHSDGRTFSEIFPIRCYEVGPDSRASMVTVSNLLQARCGSATFDFAISIASRLQSLCTRSFFVCIFEQLPANLRLSRARLKSPPFCWFAQECAANHAQALWGQGQWAPKQMLDNDLAFAMSKMSVRLTSLPCWCAGMLFPVPLGMILRTVRARGEASRRWSSCWVASPPEALAASSLAGARS